MKTQRFISLSALLLAAVSAAGAAGAAAGQQFGDDAVTPPAATTSEGDSWYRTPTVKEEKATIAQEKAMARAQARMARLDAMRWYGYSNSRPTAATMPFTTMYSPAWQMPGGRPFAWHHTSRPIVVIDRSPTVLR
ncbi:MAG: hypothetical protein DCC67_08885 [Planctomycetota bacterium]|nr:MAG: hypothetical protein DCC67_08885 [Planctomycetota bacterium]